MSSVPSQTINNTNENAVSASHDERRKRAQSLGGEEARKKMKRMSPEKAKRRSLAPRRSILKAPRPSIFDQTTTFEGNGSSSDEGETMEFTRVMEDTTMARRRVSFAASASVRTFSPAKKIRVVQSEDDSFNTSDEQSMEMASTDTTSAFAAHFAPTDLAGQQQWPAEEEYDEDSEDGDAMEMADPNEVTSAFAGQMDPARAQMLFQRRQSRISLGKFNDDEDEELRRELAEAAQFLSEAQQQELAIADSSRQPQPQPQPPRKQPRFSEVVRSQDAEDEEIRRELEALQQAPHAAHPLSQVIEAIEEEQEDGSSDEDDDDAVAMDLTSAITHVIQSSEENDNSQAPLDTGGDNEDDEDEDGEDMDLTSRTNAVEDDLTSASEMVDSTSMSMSGATTNMIEATTYGGILSAPAATPAERRRQDHLFRRLSLTGSLPSGVKGQSPSRRVSSPRRGIPAPSPARRGVSPFSTSIGQASAAPQAIFGGRSASPVRSSAPPSPQRGLVSPRRANAQSPSRADRRRTLSPVKKLPDPTVGAVEGTGVVSPARRAPPSSLATGRSPGGSLSLRGLLQEQLAKQGETGAEDTGSSFGMAADEPRVPNLSLNEFFEQSGTNFMMDVLKMTGVALGDKRRKSVAPSRQPSGPPTFADLMVAGGVKSLFHQLYQNDQGRLMEGIKSSNEGLAHVEEAVMHDYPKIFSTWASAGDEERAVMTSQFRMIKTFYHLQGRIEWNQMRSSNHDAIIAVMNDTLDGLKADNAVLAETSFEEVLPNLHDRRAALIKELQDEQARDEELNIADPMELSELHAAIEEQNDQLKVHGARLAEVELELSQQIAKADELAEQEADMVRTKERLLLALEQGQNFTKAEAQRLQSEYAALQRLHGWRLVQFTATAVKLCHLDEFDLVILFGKNGIERADLALVKPPPAGLRGDLTHFLFAKLVAHVEAFVGTQSGALAPKTLIAYVTSMWLCARRIRQEFVVANQRHPTSAVEFESSLRVSSEIHVPKAKATFIVVFELTGEELQCPDAESGLEADGIVKRIGCDVEIKFGRVAVSELKYVVRDRLDNGGRRAVVEALDAAERLCEA